MRLKQTKGMNTIKSGVSVLKKILGFEPTPVETVSVILDADFRTEEYSVDE